MAYLLRAIYDVNGAHVGFLDGPFVLDSHRHVVAELRAGIVVCIDGRAPGHFDVDRFLDGRSKCVAITRRALPLPRIVLGLTSVTPAAETKPTGPGPTRGWSRLTWRQYMQS